jgi:hypothetical protein
MPDVLHEELNGVFTGVIADACADGVVVNAFTGPHRVVIPYRLLNSEHAIGSEIRYSCIVKGPIGMADRVL